MKSLTKKMRLEKFFVSTDLAILISSGKSFQSLGAEAMKAQSPNVFKALKFGLDN